jgi:hypothetical protein
VIPQPSTLTDAFTLTKNRYIRDRVNPANNRLYRVPTGAPENSERLREFVFGVRLNMLLRDLDVPHVQEKTDHRGCNFDAHKAESALWAVLSAIGTSHLGGEKFEGDLQRAKNGVQEYTSLSLFLVQAISFCCQVLIFAH